jgi:membrane protein YqaA with SNARE-associated domain
MLAFTIGHLLEQYGYWAVFLAVGAESLGVPIPGETTLITAALFAGSSHRLNIVWIVVVASAAAIIGDNIGYLLGRVGGYRLMRRYGHYVRVDEAKMKVRLGPTDICRLLGWDEPDAMEQVPRLQRGRRHPLGHAFRLRCVLPWRCHP